MANEQQSSYAKRKAALQAAEDERNRPFVEQAAAEEQRKKNLQQELRTRILGDVRYQELIAKLTGPDLKQALQDIDRMWNIFKTSFSFQGSSSVSYHSRPIGYEPKKYSYGSGEYGVSVQFETRSPDLESYVLKNYELSSELEILERNKFLEAGGELQLIMDKRPLLRLSIVCVGSRIAYSLIVAQISIFDTKYMEGQFPDITDAGKKAKYRGFQRIFTDFDELLDVLAEAVVTKKKDILDDEFKM